jgi:Flp pilus assembly protein TadB
MEGCRDAQTRDKATSRGMNREEKEMAAALAVAIVGLAVVCILSFETCIIVFVIAATATLWTYTWGLFGKLLQESAEQQNT